MSKHIPDNQKHLTLEDRIYIERVSFMVVGALFEQTVTKLAKIVKRSTAVDWTRLLTSVIATQRRLITV